MTEPCSTRGARGGVLLLLLSLAAAGCAKEPPPSPDRAQPAVPNLAGLDVMVVPAQPGAGGVPAGFDEALSAMLETHSTTVSWILPDELERSIARAPWLNIRPRALSVSILRSEEAERIGDPLYGDLRRLGALVNARYVVVPYQVGYAPAPDSIGGHGRVEVAGAIIDTVGGRILWRGLVAGERGAAGDEVVLATAVQAFARMISPVQ